MFDLSWSLNKVNSFLRAGLGGRAIHVLVLLGLLTSAYSPVIQDRPLNQQTAYSSDKPTSSSSGYTPPVFEHSRPRVGQQLEKSFKNTINSPASLTEKTVDPLIALNQNDPYYLWHTFYGSAQGDQAHSVAIDQSGNIYIAGFSDIAWDGPGGKPPLHNFTGTYGGGDAVIVKLNKNGTYLWHTFYPAYPAGFQYNRIAVDSTGNLYVAGDSISSWNGPNGEPPLQAYGVGYDFYVLKLDANGNYQWHTFNGGTNDELANSIAVDSDGSVIVGGESWANWGSPLHPHSTGYNWDIVVEKFSSTGAYLWHTFYGAPYTDPSNPGSDSAYGVSVDSAGNVHVVGTRSNTWYGPSGQIPLNAAGETFVLKLASNGNYQWHTFYGPASCTSVYGGAGIATAVDGGGNVYTMGHQSCSWNGPNGEAPLNAFSGYSDIWLLKLNSDGAYQWHTYYGSPYHDMGKAVAVDIIGNIYLAGYSLGPWNGPTGEPPLNAFSGGYEIALLKLSGNGAYQWHTFYGSYSDDYGYGVTTDINGNVVVVGTSRQTWSGPGGIAPLNLFAGASEIVAIDTKQKPLSVSDTSTLDSNSEMDSSISCISTCSQGYKGNPINTRTGGYDYSTIDVSIQTSVGPLSFERIYASLATSLYSTVLGYGWTHNHDLYLSIGAYTNGKRQITLKGHTANQYTFTQFSGSTTAIPDPGIYATLSQGSSSFLLTDRSQSKYEFNLTTGKLISYTDPNGHKLLYTFDAKGRLTKISDESGQRYLALTYSGSNTKVASITDYTGRKVSYGYDANNNLTSVTDTLGKVWKYTYDAGHHLTQVLDPNNVIIERTEYDSNGRAVRQYDGSNNLVVELTYNANGTTTVKDALGNIETHTYDNRKTLTAEADPLGGSTSRTYDFNFRPSTLTDASGQTTSLIWSIEGADLTRLKDAMNGQVGLTYNANHNLTSLIDQRSFLTTFTYSGVNLTSITDALNKTTTYTYTPEGYLASETDPLGHTTSYTYNAQGQRTSMTDPLGKVTTYTYDNLGRMTQMTDPLGRVAKYDYDAKGQLIRTTQNYVSTRPQNDQNVYNIITEYQYDVRGNRTQVKDTYGRITTYQYDGAGRLTKTTDPAGNITTNTYNADGQLISTTDPLGRITQYGYDAAGRLIGITDPAGGITRTSYNLDGTVATTTDALGRVTRYQYDALKRVVAVTDPAGGITRTSYDAAGNAIASVDPLGRITTYEYDALNRLIKTTAPDGGVTERFYDAAGHLVQVKDPRNGTTTYTYDAAGHLLTSTDALGNVTSYEYDDAGRRTAVIDPAGNRTTYTYDLLNHVTAVTDPLGHITRISYDAVGNTASRTDANNFAFNYTYDSLNRLTQQKNPLNGITAYTYDAVGNRLTTTDPNNHTTTTTYDALNRATSVTDPNGHAYNTAYDAVGNVLSATDALSHSTTYGYDDLNRRIRVTDALGNATQYSFDAAGQMAAMTDANGVVTRYEYDSMGRLSAVVENYRPALNPDAQTNVRTEYTYDRNGNRLTIKDGSGHISNFAYDALNRLSQETDPLGNSWSYTYDALSRRASVTDAKGLTTFFSYDAASDLTLINYPAPDADVTFTYDNGGRRLNMTDGLGTTTWAYDALNRITSVTDPFNKTVSYGYDLAGNRASLTYPGGQTVSYTYDPANHLTMVNGLSSTVNYTYDNADRLTGISRSSGVNTAYTYDNANHLLNLVYSLGSGTLASYQYAYDAVGNRRQAIEQIGLPAGVLPTATPTNTATNTPTLTPTSTDTNTPTSAPTDTSTPAPTDTLTLAPTDTFTPAPTETFTPTSTDTSTPTATETPTETPTPTFTPTDTATPLAFNPGFYFVSYPLAPKTPTPTRTWTPTFTSTPAGPTNTPTNTNTPTFTPTATDTPIPPFLQTVTINYTYDPLYRLTAADYSDDRFYHYTYDAVGNRLTQQSHLGSDTYTYDNANRLTSVNGVNYSWDANGNLLNDGTNTYAYDSANRLTSLSNSSGTSVFSYNGLGDRLTQNGVQYTLDLNTDLTQVLGDGTNTYLYGLARLAERQGSANEYYLGDALGSVRQITDNSGAVTLTRTYDPFGKTAQTIGTAQTDFGFTGEFTDPTGLVFLRSRHYSPEIGRFLTRDTWDGNANNPETLNKYVYGLNNPVLYTDPSGRNPLLAALLPGIIGGLAGFAAGIAGGFAFGYTMYPWALTGQCGCEMQEQAIAAQGDRLAFAWAIALPAGILGGIGGAIAAYGPVGLIIAGGLGIVISGADFVNTWHIIKNETGWTPCTITRLLIDVAIFALSVKAVGVGLYKSVQVWRAGGSLLSWASLEPGTWGPRAGPAKGSGYEEFIRSTFNNPSNKNYYVTNGTRTVRFDAWDSTGRVLVDAKQSSGSSNYDLVLEQEWARVNVLSEARDQVAAAQLHGVKVAWYINNSGTAAILRTFFLRMNLPITVKYVPGP